MVFANLAAEDKLAFFALLDEYFASRPELAHALGLDAAAAAAHPADRPQAAADVASAIGRVAAASRAFTAPAPARAFTAASPAPAPAPAPAAPRPPPPRRTPSAHDAPAPAGVTTARKLGDLDTSSAKNMLRGLRTKDAAGPPAAPAPAPAAALPKPRASFAPPPVRRARPPTPPPEPAPAPAGEWAEALYEYRSADPGDLPLREGQRVRVTDRTSDDWWTGDADGKSGLFPATYVKLL